ncbi:MAG TPA: sensor histidine kinase KdpD [Streptosporangiaceae bacterium]|jgi:two-component system sensor histidine kinase KdpD|nr:sensor histidine kinase KdpD [Streptosporangiaceae bacterium]
MSTDGLADVKAQRAPGARGQLRVYLGSAAGVGKTFAMLNEGHRRRERGTDVVVAFVETHGRPHTAEQIGDLEVVPRARVAYRGTEFEEMDLDAVLARHPEVALVDEFAHTNVPGSRNEKRWQDVNELLDAGIDVISNVNIQHLESLNDVVEKITGVPQRETVPDAVVRAADQVELIDMTAEALRRRMAHGNIYKADKVDAALTNYFRIGNLSALRELALLWLADKVDEGLQRYREAHDIRGTWEARERVVVALTGGPEGDTLIRRAARIAARTAGGDLLAVHVTRSDGLTGSNPAALASQRRLTESLGGTYHQVVGDNVPEALLTFARAENATQLVIGVSRRSWLSSLLTGPGVSNRTVRGSGDIDVHMVTHSYAGKGRGLPRAQGGLPRQRKLAGYALAVVLMPLLTLALCGLRSSINLTSDALIFQAAVIAVALVGGIIPALVAAVAGSLLLNYYFIPPIHQFTIAQANNVLALIIFAAVGVAVSSIVDTAARRTKQAARSGAESELLATTAGSVLRGQRALSAVLDRVREAFGMESVALLERKDGAWSAAGVSGDYPVSRPDEADVEVPVSDNLVLALRGRALPATDRRVLGAFAAYAAAALEQGRLAAEAEAAKPIAEADRVRTALLAAVSHDLRTPLASAKAAVTSLRSHDIEWDAADHDELLATADESLDKLARLVDNLLDMSRLQAGALAVFPRPADLSEIVARSLDDLGPAARAVHVNIPHDLPEVAVDPAILERVVANLTANALRYSPAGTPPALAGSALRDRVELRVIDWGPGIPEDQRNHMFVPFQRMGDTDNTTGVGLGLALSRGLTEAMGGTLEPDETPGGGLTMTLSLPAVPAPAVSVGRDQNAGTYSADEEPS